MGYYRKEERRKLIETFYYYGEEQSVGGVEFLVKKVTMSTQCKSYSIINDIFDTLT